MIQFHTKAEKDVLAERERQRGKYPPEQDHAYTNDELPRAAVAFLWSSMQDTPSLTPPPVYPWHPDTWSPKNKRQELVKAAAVILAEIERMDDI